MSTYVRVHALHDFSQSAIISSVLMSVRSLCGTATPLLRGASIVTMSILLFATPRSMGHY